MLSSTSRPQQQWCLLNGLNINLGKCIIAVTEPYWIPGCRFLPIISGWNTLATWEVSEVDICEPSMANWDVIWQPCNPGVVVNAGGARPVSMMHCVEQASAMLFYLWVHWHTFCISTSTNQDCSYSPQCVMFYSVFSFSVVPEIIQLELDSILDRINYVHFFVQL